MFGSKRRKQKEDAPQTEVRRTPTSSGGYVSSELPTFHGKERKIVVYTSDSSGRIIKSFRKK